ncbi:E3 ubiquitin-protein ligase BRE1-like 1 [Impatiens glandulifera]|uniref:E3 ubiquitin-protein ligase BRE1-like 1 n=1 Tax=Impatiens glandulifera TaxID=253017 RepID=UPI001FB191F6|nr:E3 ubiquitin-protein ligase BRE1-like 1 [Impatiens glandulifera]
MVSTGESDRKRRSVSSVSHSTTSNRKQPVSEEKKIDTIVLQYQNQKLSQKLECLKMDRMALERKIRQMIERQQPYDEIIVMINKSMEELFRSCESRSTIMKGLLSSQHDHRNQLNEKDNASPSFLVETGGIDTRGQIEVNAKMLCEKSSRIIRNLESTMETLFSCKDSLHESAMKVLPEDDKKEAFSTLQEEIKNLRRILKDLLMRHKSLLRELQTHRDTDTGNKAVIRGLEGELKSFIAELEKSNSKLSAVKAGRDATISSFPILNLANKPVSADKTRDKQKDLQDMESAYKELLDEASGQLVELTHLHEERIRILKQLSDAQNTLKSLKGISSSQAFLLVKEQLAKSKTDALYYQTLFEKLQVAKDNLLWFEKDTAVKSDILDVLQKSCVVADSRIVELGVEIQKQLDERKLIETRLEESSRESGRKEVISEFKALISSFPEEMGNMQNQLSKYKEAASDVHSLRADVKSISGVLVRKSKELETLSARSAEEVAELHKLQTMLDDLKECDSELKIFLEMYTLESTDSRDLQDARDAECKAWAQVEILKSALNEHNLETRVKAAIEAEGHSQQKLTAAEAEIADLRQKLEASKREKSRLSDVLKSKNEEHEAYLFEIESIGQAYDDIQTKNQQLLQEVTERDDYNTKLVLEGVRARQLNDNLLMEKRTLERNNQQTKASVGLYEVKAKRTEDQLKMSKDHLQKLIDGRHQNTSTLEIMRKKLLDTNKSSQQLKESLEASRLKVESGRTSLTEMQVELDIVRFKRRRTEEELETLRRKASLLKSEIEGSSVVQKLRKELAEYKEILTCGICQESPKEVVITKCYHLFCNPCIQRVIESRHRKCPICATSFGANDVKPIYI